MGLEKGVVACCAAHRDPRQLGQFSSAKVDAVAEKGAEKKITGE
jgi:hypothetical protein